MFFFGGGDGDGTWFIYLDLGFVCKFCAEIHHKNLPSVAQIFI